MMAEPGLVGRFKALRIFSGSDHCTLVNLFGPVWIQPPRWVLARWWPEEISVSEHPKTEGEQIIEGLEDALDHARSGHDPQGKGEIGSRYPDAEKDGGSE